MAASKLDIWELLRSIDDNKREFLDTLAPEQRKGFVPIVTLRWLSGSGNDTQLLNLNEIVNSTAFSLYKHPDLLYGLMVAATPPGRKQYQWIKSAKKKKTTSRRVDVIRRYLDVSPTEAESFVPLYSDDDILDMATGLGETTEAIKLLKSELK